MSAPGGRGPGGGRLPMPPRFGLAATAVVLVLGAAIVWTVSRSLGRDREARAAFPMVSGQLRVDGLSERIEIVRDARGIPHVLASNESDAWFGLGFAHAQDRLAQMVWLRRIAQGRTAEWIGEAGLPGDRIARTVGFQRLAEARAPRLDDDVRTALEAYVGGVNAHLARIGTGRVAPPVALKRRLPPSAVGGASAAPAEPFTVADCLAIGKLVAWSAGASPERATVMSDLIERLGSVAARPFFPPDPGGGPGSALALSRELERLPEPLELDRERELQPFAATALRGSAWAVSGRVTASGSPILVAELSVAPTVPSLLYQAHVRGGDLDVAGATVPGLPVFLAGRNASLAWAAVPLAVVSVDLFAETLRLRSPRPGELPDSPDELVPYYQNGSRWVPVAERLETIDVRRGDAELLNVRETRHGPLVQSLLARAGTREPLALAWTGARGGDAVTGLLRVAHARDAQEVRAALRAHQEPPVEVVFADRKGEVGLQVAGWLPKRAIPSGLVPVPGRLRAFDWRSSVDRGELPSVALGGRGSGTGAAPPGDPAPWIVGSGMLQEVPLTGVSIEWLWQDPRRPQRVRQLVAGLAEGRDLELREAVGVQDDVAANANPEVLAALYALAGEPPLLSAEALEVIELLRRWDGQADVGSSGTPAYELLLTHLVTVLLERPVGAELLDRYLALPGVRSEAVVHGILVAAARGDTRGTWMDPERVGAAVRESLRRTWMSLSYRLGHNRERWKWGRLHRLEFRPFDAVDPGGSDDGFDLAGLVGVGPRFGTPLGESDALGSFGLPGRAESVATAEHARETFVADRVSTYRLGVDLASTNRMLTTLAPGQSEHPDHRHFADRIDDWRAGAASILVTSPFLLEETAADRLVLEPTR